MNGNEAYVKIFDRRIENRINNNSQITFLRGYANSVSIDGSISTVYNYLGIVVNFINYNKKYDGNLKYDDYINYLALLRNKTSSYQILAYAAFRKLSTYLCMIEICNKDYMSMIKRPKFIEGLETKKKRENNYLTKKEIHNYIDNVKSYKGKESWNERDLAIIMLFLTTGMRCAALYKLNISDINFDNNTLRTIDKERRVEEHYLSDEVIEILKNWIFKRKNMLFNRNEDALFISRNKERLSQKGIAQITKKYSQNINGKQITPHKLRATYGTQIYEKTHDIYMVQQCMGHASPTTSSIYIRGQKNKGREQASDIMSKLIF